ncbi:MAG TPA: hypothetical protein VLZ89_01910 [Anaerolineales bacterium]|nr:hypothetical protein [Anaerolineales bacterium]
MSTNDQGSAFLSEFKDFVKFLQSLWGILAGVSVFFPLSNILIKAVPLASLQDDPPGALEFLSPALITALATVGTLFIVLQTFRQRAQLRTRRLRNAIEHQTWTAFGIGIVSLLFYLAVYFGIYSVLYAPFGIWSGDPRRLIGDFALLIFYGIFFSQITRAFVLLGMVEYFGRMEKRT